MSTLNEPVIVNDVVYHVEYTYTPAEVDPAEVEIIAITGPNKEPMWLNELVPEFIQVVLGYLMDYHTYVVAPMDDFMADDFEEWED